MRIICKNYHVTGGMGAAVFDSMRCHDGDSERFSVFVGGMMAGGSIDAPDHVPCGSHCSTRATSFRGVGIPSETRAYRDFEEGEL